MQLDSILRIAAVLTLGATASAQTPLQDAGAIWLEALPTQVLELPQRGAARFQVHAMLGGELRTLDLVAHSIRAPRFEVLVAGPDGTLPARDAGSPSSYAGLVREWPGARVVASLRSDGLHATILPAGDAPAWSIQPARAAAANSGLHVAYTLDEIPPLGAGCQTLEGGLSPSLGPRAGAAARAGGVQLARLAFDADLPYYQAHGSSLGDTLAAIEYTVLTADLFFEHEVGVRHQIVGGVVRTIDPCPPGEPVPCNPYSGFQGDCFSLRNAFRLHWNQHHADIQRDVAHLFTGTPLSGSAIGCASIGSLCNPANSYAVSMRQFYPLHTAILVAHELGHIWGACHCNQDLPGNPCNTFDPAECGIMASAGLKPGFGAVTAATLQARAAQFSACLTPGAPSPAPQVSAMQPGAVQVFGHEPVVLTGQELQRVLYVHFDGTTLDLRDFEVLDPGTIAFQAPPGSFLGPAGLRLEGPGGLSAPLRFDRVETSPPRVRGDYDDGWILAGAPHQWTFGGRVGLRLDLLVSLDGATGGPPGLEILTGGRALYSTILGPPGLGTYSRFIPHTLEGIDLWSQVVLRDGNQIVEVSAPLAHHISY